MKILHSQQSPDGHLVANFVEDDCTRTNGSTKYLVTLAEKGSPTKSIEVLKANVAWNMKMRWSGDSSKLLLDCTECNMMSPEAVHYYRLKAEGVAISYAGIPLQPEKRRD